MKNGPQNPDLLAQIRLLEMEAQQMETTKDGGVQSPRRPLHTHDYQSNLAAYERQNRQLLDTTQQLKVMGMLVS